MTAAVRPTTTYADYLAVEKNSAERHEFLRGHVYAMAGGSPEHGRLAANIIGALLQGLQGRPCNVFTSAVRVRIRETDRTTYPDVSVVCGPVAGAPEDPDAVTNPIVLVEVLSDSTEADDRGEKFAHYRRLPSLREYVLVSQRTPRIEVYRRSGDEWVLSEASSGAAVRLGSIDVSLSVDEVYRNPVVASG